jgi:hypothetical protein
VIVRLLVYPRDILEDLYIPIHLKGGGGSTVGRHSESKTTKETERERKKRVKCLKMKKKKRRRP